MLARAVSQRPAESGDSAIVTFDDYTIDLSQFMHKEQAAKRPRERTTAELMSSRPQGRVGPALGGQASRRTARPAASPLYAFAGGLIGFRRARRGAHDPAGPRRRDRRSDSRFSASCACSGSPPTTLVADQTDAPIFVWAIPLCACIACCASASIAHTVRALAEPIVAALPSLAPHRAAPRVAARA